MVFPTAFAVGKVRSIASRKGRFFIKRMNCFTGPDDRANIPDRL